MLTRPVRRSLAATLLPAALLLTGCAALGNKAGPTPASRTMTATMAASPGASGNSSAGATVQLPVLAQANTTDNGVPLQVTLNRVKVDGQLLQLTFSVTNTTAPSTTTTTSAGAWEPGGFFNNGLWDPGINNFGNVDGDTVDGVYLLDAKNAKRYLVARADTKLCVCTVTRGIRVTPGTTVSFDATFKAPPADVSTVSVVIPKAPAFTNVPVQR